MANTPATVKTPAEPAKPAEVRTRVPVGAANRLEFVNLDPERRYRLVNADAARIAMFERAGYRIENLADYLPGYTRLDTANAADNVLQVGGGQKQVLMSQSREFYDEDQAMKQRKQDELEASMKPKISEGMYGDILISK